MPHAQLGPILKHVCSLAGARDLAGEADGELLRRFAAAHDEAAFAALVQRHGPMVLRVCRRSVAAAQDAEDVFQATFLLLARKAGAIRKRESVGSWLHGVAYRLARKLRKQEAGRKEHESRAAALRPSEEIAPAAWQELEAVLDEALAELPEKYRTVLVLCYLEGLTQEEAAGRIGCPLGTVRSRLARARELLKDRLARRGVGLSAGALATALAATGSAAVPSALVAAALRAASRLAAGGLRGMSAASPKMALAILFLSLTAAVGACFLSQPAAPQPPARQAGKPGEGRPQAPAADPLPDGAVARMGSTRLRHAGLLHFAFPPGGKTVLTAGDDKSLRFWDLDTGRQVRAVKLKGPAADARWIVLAPDGRTAAAHLGDRFLLWDVDSGKEVKIVPVPEVELASLFFSADGKTLAAVTWANRAFLWDWQKGKAKELELAVRKIGQDSTFHARFSPDGKWFAAGGGAGEPLCVYELPAGREAHRFRCNALTSTFSPDGKRLAVSTMTNDKGESETVVRIFDLGSGKEVAQFPQGFGDSIYSLAFSPDGKALACGFSDRGRVLDSATGRVLFRTPGRSWSVCFTADGKAVVDAYGRRLRVWDVATGTERHAAPGEFGWNPVLAVSPDGKLLAAADWMDQSVGLWDVAAGRLLRELPLKGERRYTRNLTFSPDGRTLTACQFKGFLQFWDVETGAERRTVRLEDPTYPNKDFLYYYELRLSPDARHVTTLERWVWDGAWARLVHWDAASGKPLHRLLLKPRNRQSAWTGDAGTVAVPLQDGLTLLEASSGKTRSSVPGVRDEGPFAFSPDGRLLAAGRWRNADRIEAGVREMLSGKEVGADPLGRDERVAFPSGGRFLLAAGENGVRLWDLIDGKERHRWKLPESALGVLGLALTPDGHKAITPLSDGTALVWDLASAMRAAAPAKPPGERELDAWWADLASEDARRAHAAVCRLAETPREAVAFLRGRVKPVREVDFEAVRGRVADLDAEKFQTREKAFRELEAMGDGAAPALRRALKTATSAEVLRRLETLLSGAARSPDQLRRLRAVGVLETLATDDARRLLAELADGMAEAAQTEEAKAALRRRDRRP